MEVTRRVCVRNLNQHPDLVHQHVVFEGGNYFRNPTLLEFVAENPVRHGTLPAKIVDVAKVTLDAGPSQSALNETLMLVATGSVARECRAQLPLIDLLCDHGADPNSAIHATVLHSELEAVNALIARGGRIDLPVAAALGHIEDARRLLAGVPAVGTAIWRSLWQRILVMSKSFDCCLMRAKIQTDTTRSEAIPTRHHCTKLLAAAMIN